LRASNSLIPRELSRATDGACAAEKEDGMAYLSRIQSQSYEPVAFPVPRVAAVAAPAFSDLEWSVIRLSRVHKLWTIRSPGRFARFWNWFAARGNPRLTNPRLEALRRMAVLSWHFGFTVPGDDVASFLSAGFTPDQYELMVSSIRTALNTQRTAA
jgi:hypothetical protein